jgi:hypothetical protein
LPPTLLCHCGKSTAFSVKFKKKQCPFTQVRISPDKAVKLKLSVVNAAFFAGSVGTPFLKRSADGFLQQCVNLPKRFEVRLLTEPEGGSKENGVNLTRDLADADLDTLLRGFVCGR